MLSLNENKGAADPRQLSNKLARTILQVINQNLKQGLVVVGGLFEFKDALIVELTLSDGRRITGKIPWIFDNRGLDVDEVYVEFMTYGHPDLLSVVNNKGRITRPQGSYNIDKRSISCFFFMPIEEFDLGEDESGRRVDANDDISIARKTLESLYVLIKQTLIHELTHAQQSKTGESDADYDAVKIMKTKRLGKKYYLSLAEISAHVAEIKARATRLTMMIRRDPAKYQRMVDRIKDKQIKQIAQDIDTLQQRDDRYEMMFRIALELFIDDEGINRKILPELRQQYLKYYRQKYLGVNDKITEVILHTLLRLMNK